MSAPLRVRSMIVALLGTFALACGVAAPGRALAQPAPPPAPHIDDSAPRSPGKQGAKGAKHAGVHPATLTGVLDRLERAGWIVSERASDDRRAVVVRAPPARDGGMY
ncbi:MarR family transcriptional regulator, partial [Nocardia brasiliensis]|uniref:MarR family transcriptional regulator n=1 Tax=Nocardia brasiliensis TaxID=37326 RepID=UPI002456B8A5